VGSKRVSFHQCGGYRHDSCARSIPDALMIGTPLGPKSKVLLATT